MCATRIHQVPHTQSRTDTGDGGPKGLTGGPRVQGLAGVDEKSFPTRRNMEREG